MQKKPPVPLWLLCVLLLLNGCVSLPFLSGASKTDSPPVTGGPRPAAATPLPPTESATSLPEETPSPSGGAMVLSAKTLHEAGEDPKYEIDARWPLLEWDGSRAVDAFNQAAERFVNEQVRAFKENLYSLPGDPIFQDSYSSMKIDFVPTTDKGGIFAVLFQISFYSAGAAHPGHYSHAINYDLRDGKVLSLDDIFIPGSNYLEGLSSACLEDLKARQVLEWEEGALPDAKNYQVWNITPDGILVTFDEYQVASYAAGPQSVMIPYEKLAPLLRTGGPLREYLTR